MSKIFNLTVRRWIYAVAVAAAAVLAAFGLITSEQSAAIIALAAVICGTSALALANPTKEIPRDDTDTDTAGADGVRVD